MSQFGRTAIRQSRGLRSQCRSLQRRCKLLAGRMSKVLFSATDVRPDLQQAARALHENGWLGAYYTTFALAEHGIAIRAAELLDRWFGLRLAAELRRRAIVEFPAELAKLFPWWEMPRTLASRANLDQRLVDALFHRSITGFDRHVARRIRGHSAVYAGNGAAYETFLAARQRNIPCIYSVRSFHPAFEADMEKSEFVKFPALRAGASTSDQTKRLFSERRQREWEMADLVVMHSDVCRDSYAAYGLDTTKVRVIPLGFPEIGPPVDADSTKPGDPLKILWAGTFSLRKGAHYFIQALNLVPKTVDLAVIAYGKFDLPKAISTAADRPITFRPTLPRAELLKQFRLADVLVLPTLSDAYGMAISEAMSQGLPAITTAAAGASVFIKSGENGLVVSGANATALSRALCWCALNRSALAQMRMRARETAKSWQWHHYRTALAGVLAEIVPEHCPQAGAPFMVPGAAS